MVNEFSQFLAAIFWFRQNLTFCGDASSWHDKPSIFQFGLQEYLESLLSSLTLIQSYCFLAYIGHLFLRTFSTVLGTCLHTAVHAGGVQGSAHCMVTHTRQVFYPATPNQNNAVLLQVVAFTTDVGRHFIAVGQTNPAHFPQSRVRLLRGGGVYACANATTLRARLKRGNVALCHFAPTRFAYQLIDGCH